MQHYQQKPFPVGFWFCDRLARPGAGAGRVRVGEAWGAFAWENHGGLIMVNNDD